MAYPTFDASNASSLPNVIQYTSDVVSFGSGYPFMLGVGLLILIFGVSFRASDEVLPFDQRLLSSMFITTLSSIILTALGLLDGAISGGLALLVFIAWFLVK